MKRLTLTCIILFTFLQSGYSSHILGGSLGYKHLGSQVYELTYTIHHLCGGSGPTGPSSANVQYVCGSSSTNLTLPQLKFEEREIFCADSATNSTCSTWQSGLIGIYIRTYRDTFDFSNLGGCSEGALIWSYCCRSSGTNYINQPGMVGNCSFNPSAGNSSPMPLGQDLPHLLMEGGTYNISLAMPDQDGDSLVYYLDTSQASYSPVVGFSYVNYNPLLGTPLTPIPGIQLDSISGYLSVDGTIPNGYVMRVDAVAWKVEEWDPISDTLKGFTHRELHFVTMSEDSNANPQFDSAWASNTMFLDEEAIVLQTCAFDTFQLEMHMSDTNLGDTLSAFAVYDSAIFDIEVTQTGVNPATFLIKGVTSVQSTYGISFNIRVSDDHCQFKGYSVIGVRVQSPCSNFESFQACSGTWQSISLGLDSAIWTVVSGDPIDSGTFSCTGAGCSDVDVRLSQTTTYAVSCLNQGFWYQDTFDVIVTPYPDVTITQSDAPCIWNHLALEVDVSNANSFDIQWIDNYNVLDNDTSDSAVAFSALPDTFLLPYTVNSGTQCILNDTYELVIHPYPIVSVVEYEESCIGQPFSLEATGANTYAWSPSTGLSDTVGSPTCQLGGAITYTVVGTDIHGCKASDDVSFEPNDNGLEGLVVDSVGNPITSGKVYLLNSNAVPNEVLEDSTTISSAGAFFLDLFEPTYFLKVVPDVSVYPLLAATYLGDVKTLLSSDTLSTDYCDTFEISIEVQRKTSVGLTWQQEVNPFLQILPNPAQEILTIQASVGGLSIEKVEVVDMRGRIVLEQNVQTSDLRLNVSELDAASYILSVHLSSGRIQRQVIQIN